LRPRGEELEMGVVASEADVTTAGEDVRPFHQGKGLLDRRTDHGGGLIEVFCQVVSGLLHLAF
jgi:hypothetical protein